MLNACYMGNILININNCMENVTDSVLLYCTNLPMCIDVKHTAIIGN